MSEGLLTQWRDRVVEAETEISVVQEDINALVKQRKEIKQDIIRYDKLVQREKQELLKRLEEVEAQAQELEESCQRTQQQKIRVEEMYVKTLDNYESMHEIVKEIQKEERALQEREDFESILQKESLEWAEEEHGLRTKINTMQTALKNKRKEYQEELTALETELAAAERNLQQVRRERQGELQQQVIQSTKQSRHGSPINSGGQNISVNCNEETNKQKEQMFIAANASTSVPTRQLRSCLKNNNSMIGITNTSNSHPNDNKVQQMSNSNNNIDNDYGLHYQSAPVSRATSQALVAGNNNNNNNNNNNFGTTGAGILTPHRAYSYMAGGKKVTSRKRDLLGDATNR